MAGVDALTGTYRLPCPAAGTSRVRLSSFREIERLPGVAHPAVFRVVFDCSCGDAHVALVSHDALDWEPLGFEEHVPYHNLMTSHTSDLADELAAIATASLARGAWPWSFFCYLEDAPRPVTPSSFRLLAPLPRLVAVAVVCERCRSASINLVSRSHVDVPFHTDARVGVVAHAFEEDALPSTDILLSELGAATVDERSLALRV